ncbi:MAG: membrane dipeptidase [Clostridia bacterium]|nr:membrane dipeptidase [Clostridia bacterium]
MKLIDFHCDTPAALFRSKGTLRVNPKLQVDIERTTVFDGYCQIAACFCPSALNNEAGFAIVKQYAAYLQSAIAAEPDAMLISSGNEMTATMESGKRAFLLATEDLRILNGDLSRVKHLRELGVRFATLVWRGVSCIGGAHNTDEGLSAFGREAVTALLESGIVPDVSHASRETLRQTAEICHAHKKPFVATHSCAFALCSHRRNLTDEEIRLIAESGGVIGVNLYPPFLRADAPATLSDITAHVRHLFRVAGTDAIVMGTDLDGVDLLPEGIKDVADLPQIVDAMQKAGFTTKEIDRLFYQNGLQFIKNHLN